MLHETPVSTSGFSALRVASRAARSAGLLLAQRFGGAREIAYKGRGNLVTDADRAAEACILEMVTREYPEHNLLTEESSPTERGSEYTWVIDPLDGTSNYAFGFPAFAVSVALVRDGAPIVGAIYEPLRDELWLAERGQGATLNGKTLSIVARDGESKDDLSRAVVGFDMGYQAASRERALQVALAMVGDVQSYRLIGSAVLGIAYVASGRLDLYCHYWLYAWDLAAAWLVAEEAGARVMDWQGSSISLASRGLICGRPYLAEHFRQMVEQKAAEIVSP
mgnify:CR=1 FL=1